MEFTPHETKLIERLRKEDRQWAWGRWVVLVCGVLCIVMCGLVGYLLYRIISDAGSIPPDSKSILVILLFWTKCCMYFVFGVWCFVIVCTKWHGDVNRMLLLKLLDAQQKEATKDSTQPRNT
jgi:hypothetical protein